MIIAVDGPTASGKGTISKALAAHYFLAAKAARGGPVDPVARFHLGNGAVLERLNFLGDMSPKGVAQAHTMMVNYLYNLKEIEKYGAKKGVGN